VKRGRLAHILELVERFVLLAWIDSGGYRPLGEVESSLPVVGKAGFEPAISQSRTERDTRLRHFPKQHFDIPGSLFDPGDHSFPNRVTIR
jgi:hypothetical protein